MTGGGFGGFAIALADAGREQAIRSQVSQAFRNEGWPGLSIQVTQPSAGAASETVAAPGHAPG
jgi:galactokinase